MKSTLLVLILTTVVVGAANTWRVDEGEVRVTCPMTVGGSFTARTTAISGSVTDAANGPGALDGTLAVDLRNLDTGIGLRNRHLREKYLEVDRGPGFETVTLSGIEVTGLDPDSTEGRGSFTGLLSLHGVVKAVTGPVEVRRTEGGRHVKASFPVTLADFGIRKPRQFGIGVKDTVVVDVDVAVAREMSR